MSFYSSAAEFSILLGDSASISGQCVDPVFKGQMFHWMSPNAGHQSLSDDNTKSNQSRKLWGINAYLS